MQEEAKKRANLKLLQRTFQRPFEELYVTASHVVLYQFTDQQWQKANIEGSLFLVADTTSHVLCILNRSHTDNFVLDLASENDYNVQESDPYLILKTTTQIYGLWFHDPTERHLLYTTLSNVPPLPAPPAVADATSALKSVLGISSEEEDATPPLPPSTTTTHTAPAHTTATTKTTNTTTNPPPPSQPLLLDKRALQLTLLSLLQNDQFLDIVHAQYTRVVQQKQQQQQKKK